MVYVIPKDTSVYGNAESAAADDLELASSPKKYLLSGQTSDITGITAASIDAQAVLTVKNQFGEEMQIDDIDAKFKTTDQLEFTRGTSASVIGTTLKGDGTNGMRLEVTWVAANKNHTVKISSDNTSAITFQKGDTFTYKINSSTKINVICTSAGSPGESKWKVTVEN